jgi:protein SCO1/2
MNRRIILSILAATLAGCASGEKSEEAWVDKRYALTGEVIRLEEKDKIAVVKHDEIPDFMEAMTMGFPVLDAAEWGKLKPGMKIKATVVERKDDFYLTAIEEVE